MSLQVQCERTRNSSEKRKWRGEIKTLKGELKQREEVNPVQYTLRWHMHVQCSIHLHVLVLHLYVQMVYVVGTHYVYTILE